MCVEPALNGKLALPVSNPGHIEDRNRVRRISWNRKVTGIGAIDQQSGLEVLHENLSQRTGG